MTTMPDLGSILFDAVLSVPGTVAGWVAERPGPWIIVALMMVGLVALSRVARKRRKR